MNRRLLILFAVFCAGVLLAQENVPVVPVVPDKAAVNPEERKLRFAALQKELEAARPGANAIPEEVSAYVELLIEGYGKFAQAHPKTAEGFEAAFTTAAVLAQVRHPQMLKFAELAVKSVPPAGVDVKRVAMAWTMVAGARLTSGAPRAEVLAAVEEIRPLDEGMYTHVSEQLKQIDAQRAERDQASKVKPGDKPLPLDHLDTKGRRISLEALKGKVVLLDFWAPWCGPCMVQMPHLAKLYAQYQVQGLEIIGISLDDLPDHEALQAVLTKHSMTWPVISDHTGFDNLIAQEWEIVSIPSLFLIDRKGIVRHLNLHGEELNAAVAELLKEQP